MNLVFASGFLFPQRILGIDYFRDLPARYPDALFPEVAVNGHIADRAPILARKILDRFPDGDIHIVAHSMGGLDSRYLLSKNLLGLAGHVVSLSTVSTPHRGSLVADVVLGLLPGLDAPEVRAMLNHFHSIESGALDDLACASAAQFNRDNPDAPGVRYLAYYGYGPMSLALRPTHDWIQAHGTTAEERINDGVVSLASAKWPDSLVEEPWPADHLAQIGHNLDTLDLVTTFDHKAAFDRVVQRAAGSAENRTARA